MQWNARVKRKIKAYKPKNGLDKVALFAIALAGINHPTVLEHIERVALTADAVARRTKKDPKAAFLSALLHDVGKLIFRPSLFDGRNISDEEYAQIKRHAMASYRALKDLYLFTALCAGMHHAVYDKGYGLTAKDFPPWMGPRTIKKILEISTIIAICDDIDAALHRRTTFKGATGSGKMSLEKRLSKKFPDDVTVVKIALEEARKFV